jgi:hypothetical protein
MVEKIYFFGDSELTALEPIYFIKTKQGYAVCDTSECGIYVASKLSNMKGSKISLMTLNKLIWLLMGLGDISKIYIEAYNNGIYRFLQRNFIKTVEDLRQYFIKLLGCSYP